MTGVCLVDTSVFLEILNVPRKAAAHRQFIDELKRKIDREESLFLPMATIVETGNHIAQNGDGQQRREAAERFVRQIELALAGESPFQPLRFPSTSDLKDWLVGFPDWSMRGIGLADRSIRHDWLLVSRQHRARRVYVWTRDQHLAGCDTHPVNETS